MDSLTSEPDSIVSELTDLAAQIKKLQESKKAIQKKYEQEMMKGLFSYAWLKNKKVKMYCAFSTGYYCDTYMSVEDIDLSPLGGKTFVDKANKLRLTQKKIKGLDVVQINASVNIDKAAKSALRKFCIKYDVQFEIVDKKHMNALWLKFLMNQEKK